MVEWDKETQEKFEKLRDECRKFFEIIESHWKKVQSIVSEKIFKESDRKNFLNVSVSDQIAKK